jgi:type I restriction enzyme R subunit
MTGQFNGKQRAFLDFVLTQYVIAGGDELDREKLSPLLRLKLYQQVRTTE